jgi:hypothetical protein
MNKNIITDIKFDIIIKYANLICPNEYDSQFTNEYYLENILLVLNNFVSWKALKYSNTIKSNKEYHYKTIHKNIFYGAIIIFIIMLIMKCYLIILLMILLKILLLIIH